VLSKWGLPRDRQPVKRQAEPGIPAGRSRARRPERLPEEASSFPASGDSRRYLACGIERRRSRACDWRRWRGKTLLSCSSTPSTSRHHRAASAAMRSAWATRAAIRRRTAPWRSRSSVGATCRLSLSLSLSLSLANLSRATQFLRRVLKKIK